jgi:hypothetical protein
MFFVVLSSVTANTDALYNGSFVKLIYDKNLKHSETLPAEKEKNIFHVQEEHIERDHAPFGNAGIERIPGRTSLARSVKTQCRHIKRNHIFLFRATTPKLMLVL